MGYQGLQVDFTLCHQVHGHFEVTRTIASYIKLYRQLCLRILMLMRSLPLRASQGDLAFGYLRDAEQSAITGSASVQSVKAPARLKRLTVL